MDAETGHCTAQCALNDVPLGCDLEEPELGSLHSELGSDIVSPGDRARLHMPD